MVGTFLIQANMKERIHPPATGYKKSMWVIKDLCPARGAGTLIPSAQRLVWVAKEALGKAALGALFA